MPASTLVLRFAARRERQSQQHMTGLQFSFGKRVDTAITPFSTRFGKSSKVSVDEERREAEREVWMDLYIPRKTLYTSFLFVDSYPAFLFYLDFVARRQRQSREHMILRRLFLGKQRTQPCIWYVVFLVKGQC
jgi:hypothetical protein